MAKCCIPNCQNIPEWEHSWIYAGKQINEWWAIVPMCTKHHRIDMFFYWDDVKYNAKDYGRWVSLMRAGSEPYKKYPKKDWDQQKKYLDSLFLRDKICC